MPSPLVPPALLPPAAPASLAEGASSPWLPRQASSEDPVAWLLECHARIRRVCRATQAVAQADPADPRRAPTAQDAARYLRMSLLLHAEDEDLSLEPRLRAASRARAQGRAEALTLGRSLDRMHQEHLQIEAGLPAVVQLLEAVATGGAAPSSLPSPGDCQAAADWLSGLLLPHVDHEEAQIFPAAVMLSPQDKAAIAAELRARRTLP